jgi:hypothetical protein
MHDRIDWDLTTYEGVRRRQRQEFCALPLREKIALVEQMGEIAADFAARRAARLAPRAVGSGSSATTRQPGGQAPERD